MVTHSRCSDAEAAGHVTSVAWVASSTVGDSVALFVVESLATIAIVAAVPVVIGVAANLALKS